jgi:MFS transporter, PAT family, beta-lactamase induction signal transducer AmpG
VKNPLSVYPDLLASARGRSIAFFSFYFIDGVLIAFMATSIAMRMRAQQVTPTEIGFFVATLYLPASWKWVFGPLVDLCYFERLGRRRGWILVTEALMIVILLGAMRIDFIAEFMLFTIVMMFVNLFAAMQRIAVNALACNILTEQERGTANGMMYAGAYLGQVLGGSGVILLSRYLPFQYMFVIVAASIAAVMLFVAFPLDEPKTPIRADGKKSGLAAVGFEVRNYAIQAFNAFRGSRAAVVGLIFVLLPAGAVALSLSLGTNLMVEFGMSDNEKSLVTLVSILVAAFASLGGGHLSDWFGRRKMLALYIVGGALPALWLAYVMYRYGWIMPIDQAQAVRPVAPLLLIASYWAVVLLGSAFQGLLYATRSALFMDICTPAVAATQFTAYMAMVNLTVAYSSAWQGWCVDKLGYPSTLALDALLGMASLPLLLLMGRPVKNASAESVTACPSDDRQAVASKNA